MILFFLLYFIELTTLTSQHNVEVNTCHTQARKKINSEGWRRNCAASAAAAANEMEMEKAEEKKPRFDVRRRYRPVTVADLSSSTPTQSPAANNAGPTNLTVHQCLPSSRHRVPISCC